VEEGGCPPALDPIAGPSGRAVVPTKVVDMRRASITVWGLIDSSYREEAVVAIAERN
jgi:hypothetical protein